MWSKSSRRKKPKYNQKQLSARIRQILEYSNYNRDRFRVALGEIREDLYDILDDKKTTKNNTLQHWVQVALTEYLEVDNHALWDDSRRKKFEQQIKQLAAKGDFDTKLRLEHLTKSGTRTRTRTHILRIT